MEFRLELAHRLNTFLADSLDVAPSGHGPRRPRLETRSDDASAARYTVVTPIGVRHESKFRPTTSTLGEVNIRRLVLRQFNQFAAAIVLGKNFAVKQASPP